MKETVAYGTQKLPKITSTEPKIIIANSENSQITTYDNVEIVMLYKDEEYLTLGNSHI